ncbi:SOS response-associated peptidase [Achromobacter mucicolens]|uniref:SOS response-associated peptidase family protein n=1 Tax=Achromobacter mucicolens TaxID=1389922 RepID=UPI0020A56327|nr:SOS response-associated peptidase family protein [Achromobacter mucicolens]MCP2517382.1 SOS response-associated peptidase [Achromobacter mucicolens]
MLVRINLLSCHLTDFKWVGHRQSANHETMCSHYQTVKDAALLLKKFGIARPGVLAKYDMSPRYQGVFVQRPPEHGGGDEAVPARESPLGRWGLISAMTKADGLEQGRQTFHLQRRQRDGVQVIHLRQRLAPRAALHHSRRCHIFEPDWRSGTAVATRFTLDEGGPLGIAGLWDRYRDAAGQWHDSYTMLTINAGQDPLFRDYHQPNKEKRMVVILPEVAYGDWLTASPDESRNFLALFPSDKLVAAPMT